MKHLHLLSGLALMLGSLHIQAQPQWRFHLAFEDATGAKDTLWFIYDTTATVFTGNQDWDFHLGEGPVDIELDEFSVWMGNFLPSQGIKVNANPYSQFPQGSIDAISASSYTPPLIVRWDTSLFHAPFLPSTPTSYIRYAGLLNYYFWMSGEANFGTDGFDMMLVDSVVVGPMLVDWFFTSSYMLFAYESWLSTGMTEHSLPSLEIYPNPTKGRMVINAPEPLTEIRLLDELGRAVLRVAPTGTGPVELDVSGLPAGSYLVHARGRAGMYRGRVVVE